MVKLLIVVALAAIVIALGAAVFFMLGRDSGEATKTTQDERDMRRSKQMASALKWRVIISVSIFATILIAWAFGWIRPGGVPMGQ